MSTDEARILLVGQPERDPSEALRQAGYAVWSIPVPARIAVLLAKIRSLAVDVVGLDIDSPGFDWISAVHEATRLPGAPRVFVMGDLSKRGRLLAAFREGADACLAREDAADELVTAMKALNGGRVYMKREDAEIIRNHMLYLELGSARHVADVQDGIARLTVREKEVFPLLADGLSVKETAGTLGISPKTVESHKYRIMKKLGLKNMAEFTKLAVIKDLIPL